MVDLRYHEIPGEEGKLSDLAHDSLEAGGGVIVEGKSDLDKQNHHHLDESRDEAPPSPFRWAILSIFCMIAQGNGMIFLALSSISDKIQLYYDVSSGKVNLVVILFYACYIPCTPIATTLVNLADNGLRKSVLIAAASMTIGTGIMCTAWDNNPESFTTILIGSAVAGTNGPFLTGCFTLVPSNWFPREERGFATSIGVLANQVGMITGYLLPPLIVTESADDEILGKQIHILLLVLFGISCSTLLLTFFIFKSKPDNMSYEDLHSSRRQMTLLTAFKSSLTNANFWFYGLAFMIVAPIYWDMGTLLNQNMKPAGYSNSEIQIPGILLQTVAIPGMLLTGKLIDAGCKFEYILIFGMVLGTAAFGLFTWILTLESSQMNLVYISLAASAAGFAFSIVQPAYLDLIAQRTAPIPLGLRQL